MKGECMNEGKVNTAEEECREIRRSKLMRSSKRKVKGRMKRIKLLRRFSKRKEKVNGRKRYCGKMKRKERYCVKEKKEEKSIEGKWR